MNRFGMLLKREWWENKGGFFWAPAWTAIVFATLTVGGLFTAVWHTSGRFNGEVHIGVPLKRLLEKMSPEDYQRVGVGLDTAMMGFWSILQVVLFFVLFFYLLGALYDERKDRSVLFWKSLPVSDLSTVLSKVAMAALGAPALSLAITILINIVFLSLLSLFVLFNGLNPVELVWGPAEPLALWSKMLALVPINALWALPAIGWLLLVSAWARTKPMLWAIVVPVALGVFIGWFEVLEALRIPDTWYWRNIVARILASLVPGSWMWTIDGAAPDNFDFESDGLGAVISWSVMREVLTATTTWLGALAGTAMIAASIYLRRYRELAD